MSTQKTQSLQRMEPADYFFEEQRVAFNEAFDLMRFDPTPKGFIALAEGYSQRAFKQGIDLHPFHTAMFLIEWWRSKEMVA